MVPRTDFHNLIDLRGSSIQINGNDRLCLRILLKCALKRLRRHVPCIRLTVNKNGNRFLIDNWITGCRKRQRRRKYNVSLPHSRKLDRKVDRRCSRIQRRRISGARICADLLLKRIHVRSKRRYPVRVKRFHDEALFVAVHRRT